MKNEQIQNFKKKLEAELTVLESDLKSVGRVNPENPGDWEPVPADQDIQQADDNELGDKFEEYEENTAILKPLESRYNEIKRALAKINGGAGNGNGHAKSFGVCEICEKEIKLDRLEANPAATTCKEHMG